MQGKIQIKKPAENFTDWKKYSKERKELARMHPLRYLFLEVTRMCNLSCRYCGSNCTAERAHNELDCEVWRKIIRQVAEDFEASKIMVAVTGGEPLVRGDIFEIFAELKNNKFNFGMVTNGILINAAMASRLCECGIGSISISFDAPDEINDLLRGTGSAAKARCAIIELQDAGYKGILEIISTITKPVIPYLDRMRTLIAGLRIPHWRMAPVMPIGRASGQHDLLLDAHDMRTLLDYITAARRDGFKPVPAFSEEGFLGNDYEGVVRPYLYRCNAGITIAGIQHDGSIGACPELGDCFIQGHIRSDRFSHVWETRYQNMRDRSWTYRGECKNCDAWEPCTGGALHLYQDTDSCPMRCFYKTIRMF